MGKKTYLTDEEAQTILNALKEGEADQLFSRLAIYLERNQLQLSDEVMRLYIQKELFVCFTDRNENFASTIL